MLLRKYFLCNKLNILLNYTFISVGYVINRFPFRILLYYTQISVEKQYIKIIKSIYFLEKFSIQIIISQT